VEEHGVAREVIEAASAASRRFFELPEDVKLRHVGRQETNWRGYGPYGSNQNCSPNSSAPERKETFYCGVLTPGDESLRVQDVEGFTEAIAGFHAAMLRLSRVLLRGLSLSLDLPPEHFEKAAFRAPDTKVLLASYPPVQKDEVSCGAHTDCGFLTLVCQEGAPGLHARRRDGTWLSIEGVDNAIVANLGELAARWTNDIYRSTPHRVLNCSEGVRRSLIFFNNLDEDAEVSCLPSCVSPEQPAKYKATSCGKYVAARMRHLREGFVGDFDFELEWTAEPGAEERVLPAAPPLAVEPA